MEITNTIAAVRERVRAWHRDGLRVAFLPTVGNIDAGPVSLIEAARSHGDRFVASLFVNPMQFGPNEDFAHYPRTPTQDERMLAEAGCNLMFMPDVAEIYPNGAERATRIDVPGLSRILCGEFRPGHFEGVATVVAKLFHIVMPDAAVFGEKDFQQLTVIRRMVADLCIPVRDHRRSHGARRGWACHELAESIPVCAGAQYCPTNLRNSDGDSEASTGRRQ